MACNRLEIDRLAKEYAVQVDLIDMPIGVEGYMAVISGRDLNWQEIKELEYKLVSACSDIHRVTVEISPQE